jgi:hypothetical protein
MCVAPYFVVPIFSYEKIDIVQSECRSYTGPIRIWCRDAGKTVLTVETNFRNCPWIDPLWSITRSHSGSTIAQLSAVCRVTWYGQPRLVVRQLCHNLYLVGKQVPISVAARIRFFSFLTFSVRHLNAIKSTAGRSFLGIKPLPALQQM